MTPQPPVVLREELDGVARLTLNRPAQLNLLTSEMIAGLQTAFDAIAGDEQVRVAVLAAAGKGFCAGHDLKEIRALRDAPRIQALFESCNRLMLAPRRCRNP
jgi:enoyl-CoA hydratase/carnithine racemase